MSMNVDGILMMDELGSAPPHESLTDALHMTCAEIRKLRESVKQWKGRSEGLGSRLYESEWLVKHYGVHERLDKQEKERVERWWVTYNAAITGLIASNAVLHASIDDVAKTHADKAHGPLNKPAETK